MTTKNISTRWEQLFSKTDEKNIVKILDQAKHPEMRLDAWQSWGKLVKSRSEKLDFDSYRQAVHWVSLYQDTKAMFTGKSPFVSPEQLSKDSPALEYHLLSTLLVTTLQPDMILEQTPEQWMVRYIAMITFLKERASTVFSVSEQPLFHQLICAELPWLVASLFPELVAFEPLIEMARTNFKLGFTEILDGAGLPHAGNYHQLLPLLSCWTRALMLGKKVKMSPWDKEEQNQYEWVVQQALRFWRQNGSAVFSDTSNPRIDPELLKTALAFDKDKADHSAARVCVPRLFTKEEKNNTGEAFPESATFSQWARLAMLRTDWSPKSPSFAVAFAPVDSCDVLSKQEDFTDQTVRTELNIGGKTLWNDLWQITVRLDGKTLKPDGKWMMTCDASDEDADYLELELILNQNMRLQRHFLLAHRERILLMADTILPDKRPENGINAVKKTWTLDYEMCFPVAENITLKSGIEANEVDFYDDQKSPVLRLFPLSFPEWKKTPDFQGSLVTEKHQFSLQQQGIGTGMFIPLVFDLDAKRLKQPYTWRQLTVGEKLSLVPPDRAAAFRLQTGKNHTLYYRSLTEKANRTFFGHNLVSEFFCGRFEPKTGLVETLMEAEEEESM